MKTRRDNTVDNYHGTMVPDPYRWLEQEDDPEVAAWIKSQNELTEEFLNPFKQREEIEARLTELWDYPRTSIPVKVGDWYYYQKNDGLQNQPVLYRQKGLKGGPELVLDPNTWSNDGTVALSNFSPEETGRYLAYTVSAQGSDRQEIKVLDLQTGKKLVDNIKWCRFTNIAWLNRDGFYYSRYPEPGTVAKEDETNFNQIYWHKLGTEQAEDKLIFSCPKEKELSFSPSITADQNYLILHVFHGTDRRNGFYYQDLTVGGDFVRLFSHGEAKYQFLGNEGAIFYFLTDLNSPKGRIISVDISKGKSSLLEILPEQADVISLARLVNHKLVIAFMHNAYSLLKVYNLKGELKEEIALPELGSIEGLTGRQSQQEIFINFTSFLYPARNFHYDLEAKRLTPFGNQQLNFKPDNFTVKQVFYPSYDGTKVSMFLVHKKDLKLNGDNPALLYGYGGFNIPITPSFSPSRLLWLEMGGIYAVANLRGGSEYGEEWHRAGMLANKQNVFDDFMAAAEWLVEKNYTRPAKLAIEGRSNGGLLVSACLVQKPHLFGAVICGVPVTDMLRYHKFTVGRYWIPEYGDGEKNPEHFKFLYKYSPLHNVKQAEYPATLVVTAEGDDRVVPSHAYKFAAALQREQSGKAPILIRIDGKAGHGHGKPVGKIIREHTDIYTFLSAVLGI